MTENVSTTETWNRLSKFARNLALSMVDYEGEFKPKKFIVSHTATFGYGFNITKTIKELLDVGVLQRLPFIDAKDYE